MDRRSGQSVFTAGLSKLCLHRRIKQKQTSRVVFNNVTLEKTSDHDLPPQVHYKTNVIKTTKYTILTFLPKNLFEQFHRFANIYFLFIALLNFIPQVNAFGEQIALIPVIGVLAVTGIKDGYEDYRRYRQDKKVNTTKCLVFEKKSRQYKETRFMDILVGDIVRVKCNEVIPADLLLLGCSEETSTCFIETANLDGESNLKQRTAVSLDDSGVFLPQTHLRVECETPNAVLNKFTGFIQSENGKKKLLSKENLLLRGCVLRNTDFIEGIAIYAGHDTKAMLNSSGPRYKRSKLETNMNKDILWCLVILLFLCFFSAIGNGVWLNEKQSGVHDIPYIPPPPDGDGDVGGEPALEGFVRFWTFIIIYQIMIPLSLYATLEIVKSCQVYFIHHDAQMYYEEGDIQPVCRALNITEDLGQVQHIFSDKTGTLTENKMVFKACSIGEMLFTEKDKSNSKSDDETQLSHDPLFVSSHSTSVLAAAANSYSSQTDLSETDNSKINEFLLLLATCNTVVVSSHSHYATLDASMVNGSTDSLDTTLTTPNGLHPTLQTNGSASGSTLDVPLTTFTPVKNAFRKITDKIKKSLHSVDDISNVSLHSMTTGNNSMLSKKTLKSRYEAESPDELALVKAVCNYGCRLLSRTNEFVSVFLPAHDKITYKVLVVLPFDSTRKCMSVVMQRENSDEIVMYTKGADNMIFDKIKDDEPNQALLKKTRIYVNHFAKDGLRTLCMAKKIIPEGEFYTWYEQFTNCDMEDREAEQFRLCNELEQDLELLGATGIEDRLQEGVAESVRALEAADIKVWVLTGDKQETAINIGYSCGLLPRNAAILTLNVPNADEVEGVLKSHLSGTMNSSPAAEGIPRCLVVDGKTLGHIFADDVGGNRNLSRLFLRLAESCLSVLCCRTTPSQKAQVVDLVKSKSKKLVLSIGDGANDVNMIRTANVGVGIEGLEGKQASMAADFSIGRFKHLVRLLFVHGHWSYDRLAVMTLYNFYKNSNLIFVLFWYQIYCMFSGQNHIDQIYLIVFHLLFTSLPPIVLGILDQDLPDHVLMSHPQLYKQGPQNKLYHRYSYWLHILDALYQSLVIFFVSYMHYRYTDVGVWSLGTIQTVSLVIAQWTILLMETRSWHWPFIASNIASVLCFWGFIMILGAACVTCDEPSNPYWVVQHILSTADSWLCVALGAVIAIIPRLVCSVLANMFYPTDAIHARSLVLSGKITSRPKVNLEFPINVAPTPGYGDESESTLSA